MDTAYREMKRTGRFRCLLANYENFQFLPLHFLLPYAYLFLLVIFFFWSLYAISIVHKISHSKPIYPLFFFTFIHCKYMIDSEELPNKPFFVETISICDYLVSGYLYLLSMDVNYYIFVYKCFWHFLYTLIFTFLFLIESSQFFFSHLSSLSFCYILLCADWAVWEQRSWKTDLWPPMKVHIHHSFSLLIYVLLLVELFKYRSFRWNIQIFWSLDCFSIYL